MSGTDVLAEFDATATVGQLLKLSRTLLPASESPDLDFQLLLMHCLSCSRASLLAQDELLLNEDQQTQLLSVLKRRQAGEPVAYILGCREFWDFELKVDSRVLIPRPETELLVEQALLCLKGREGQALRLLDLGTGSGAIAIALARHSQLWQVTAVDQSEDSLALAQDNACTLEVKNIEFECGSWFDSVGGDQFDLIVSNPPYVAADDSHLLADGLCYEPRDALVASNSGLACLQEIISGGLGHLQPGGWLLLEHGFNQGAEVSQMMEAAGYEEIRCWRDLAGLDRVTLARYPHRE